MKTANLSPLKNEDEALKRLRQKINKLRLDKSRVISSVQHNDKSLRKKRTRTLIQLGGLVDKLDILKDFNIEIGDDLQLDSFEQTCMLFGFLKTCIDAKMDTPNDQEMYLKVGKAYLKK